jgi:hypothetical protein
MLGFQINVVRPGLFRLFENRLLTGSFRHFWLEVAVDAGVSNKRGPSPIIRPSPIIP